MLNLMLVKEIDNPQKTAVKIGSLFPLQRQL
jgi:hypothetical protein